MDAHARRMPGLDLLRALAIAWVMLFHSYLVGGLGPDWAWLSRYGWMGVDLFFALSGFLICGQLLAPMARGERLRFGDFYLRRALRILPAFWAMLALYAFFPVLREAPGLEPAWKFLAFVYNLSVDYRAHAAFSHAWSLCVEEHFYLLFPLLAALCVPRIGPRGFVVLLLAVTLAGIGLRSQAWLAGHAADPSMLTRNWFVEDVYYPSWNRLDSLLAGVVLATVKVFRPAAWSRLQAAGNVVLLAALVVLAMAMWLFRERTGLQGNSVGWPVLAIGMGLLVCAGAGRASLIGRWRLPGMAWLATLSYSVYLAHKVGYHLVQAQWGEWLEGRGALAFLAYALGALLAGALLHYVVERPCLGLRDRWLAQRRPQVMAASAGAH